MRAARAPNLAHCPGPPNQGSQRLSRKRQCSPRVDRKETCPARGSPGGRTPPFSPTPTMPGVAGQTPGSNLHLCRDPSSQGKGLASWVAALPGRQWAHGEIRCTHKKKRKSEWEEFLPRPHRDI